MPKNASNHSSQCPNKRLWIGVLLAVLLQTAALSLLSFSWHSHWSIKNANISTAAPIRIIQLQSSANNETLNISNDSYYKKCVSQGYSKGTPIEYTENKFIIEQKDFCKANISILYFIHSSVGHRQRRDAIRQSWVKGKTAQPYQVLFVLGATSSEEQMEDIRKESLEFKDLIQADFIDSYRNLTYKHLYALKWISLNCRQAKFIFKADDDVVVNVKKVQELLSSKLSNRRNFVYCEVAITLSPHRDVNFTYYMSPADWPGKKYPKYCQGLGYILSSDTVDKILQCSRWRHYLWIDDLFVTGAVREALNIDFLKAFNPFRFSAVIKKPALGALMKASRSSQDNQRIKQFLNNNLVVLDPSTQQNSTNIKEMWNLL